MQSIPVEEYKKIMELMPIFCVDIVLAHKGKVLLVKRKNEPAKEEFWFIGGRVFKNEKMKDAAIRKVKEEVGLDAEIVRQVGAYEFMSDKAVFPDIKTGIHSPVVLFLIKLLNDQEVKLDDASSEFKWINKIEPNLHPYVKQALEDSGVFNSPQFSYIKIM